MVPLCITDSEYEDTTQKCRILVSFCHKLTIFDKTVG
jgi:hypothetical protein